VPLKAGTNILKVLDEPETSHNIPWGMQCGALKVKHIGANDIGWKCMILTTLSQLCTTFFEIVEARRLIAKAIMKVP
tara:strand:+ start:100 stop:330 length:231 start_codon:yes stop_codon:yes gene_type:complete